MLLLLQLVPLLRIKGQRPLCTSNTSSCSSSGKGTIYNSNSSLAYTSANLPMKDRSSLCRLRSPGATILLMRLEQLICAMSSSSRCCCCSKLVNSDSSNMMQSMANSSMVVGQRTGQLLQDGHQLLGIIQDQSKSGTGALLLYMWTELRQV